jgi:beta-mannosidase
LRTRPEPFKFIKFPQIAELGLKVDVGLDGETITLSTRKPIKGIVLDVDGEFLKFSNQAIDLVPGDPQIVKAVSLGGRSVKIRFLGDGTA